MLWNKGVEGYRWCLHQHPSYEDVESSCRKLKTGSWTLLRRHLRNRRIKQDISRIPKKRLSNGTDNIDCCLNRFVIFPLSDFAFALDNVNIQTNVYHKPT